MSAAAMFGMIATVVGSLTSISPLLQVRAIVRERSSDQISLSYLWVLEANFSAWIAYGIVGHLVPVVAVNTLSLLIMGVVIVVTLHYRKAPVEKLSDA